MYITILGDFLKNSKKVHKNIHVLPGKRGVQCIQYLF